MNSRARRIHDELPVVDGHNDLPWALRTEVNGRLEEADPRGRLDGFHTDLPRMLRGGVGVQFWSVYVPMWTEQPLRSVHNQIDLVEEMSTLAPEMTALAGSADEARAIRAGGRVAGLMGAEGGHSIEEDLNAISDLWSRGVRYMTLTHADTISWADSATDHPRHGGLTEFGRRVIGEMNRVGMIVDVSHVSADTMRQATEQSSAPVMASHSGAFAIAPHPRNVPNDVLEMIGAGGGIVMVPFVPAFLVAETARDASEMFEESRRLRKQFDAADEKGFAAELRRRTLSKDVARGGVGDVADHIEHIAAVAGIDHVGLGSDFDGTELLPEGLEDVSSYPAITDELLGRGWSEPDVRKVLGENAMRVLEQAEQMAV